VHHVGILYDQFMMHGQRNIKLRETKSHTHIKQQAKMKIYIKSTCFHRTDQKKQN